MTLGPDQRFDWKPPQIISKIHLIRAQVSSEFLRRKCTNFKNRGGYAANRRTRADCSDWMELCMERETGSAASEHAFGVQTAAGEGHRRSLLSCSPLGWGRLGRSVGNKSANVPGTFGCGRNSRDAEGTQHFENDVSNLWPGPSYD